MALDNAQVLANLQEQLRLVEQQLIELDKTSLRLAGAIDVLQQIEQSKSVPEPEPEPENAPIYGARVERN
jgi:hypothetical protein